VTGGTAPAAAGGTVGTGATVGTGGQVASGPLIDRISTSSVTIPEGVKAGVSNWRIWERGDLYIAPVVTVPLANCGTLVCYTTDSGSALTARVAYLDPNDQLVSTFTVAAGLECRGLAAEPDGHFAALVWDDAADRIYVSRFDLAGTPSWSEELTNSDNTPDAFDIGGSRLEYGNGTYGAYYHVHSNSGHEGDTLKWVDAASGAESTGWDWGCSHSMSVLLRYNPALTQFLPVCVTDCYPGTTGDFTTDSRGGIYLNHDDSKVLDVDGGCNGSVAGEVGGAALAPDGWKLVFNAHQNPMTPGQSSYNQSTMNQDIGFVSIAAGPSAGSVVWLTSTASIDEADSSIARWQPSDDATEQYVVGWSEPGASYTYQLARVDASGGLLEGPVDVTASVRWGRRDDPFRQHYDGDVVWAWFDEPGSTSLHIARLDSGGSATCATF
jgi:hypothetical protein